MEFIKMIFAVIGLLSLIGGGAVLVLYVSKKVCKKRQKKFVTFTKTWVPFILINAVIWVYLSYILAYLGREQIAENLSTQAIVSIISTISVYLIKSYLEKKIGKEKENYENQLETEIDEP